MRAAWESVHLASVALADGSPIKQRLVVAFSKYLAEIDGAELPRPARQELDSIRRELTRVPPLQGESAVMATVRKMSNDEASRQAQRIVRLLGVLADEDLALRPRHLAVVPVYGAEA